MSPSAELWGSVEQDKSNEVQIDLEGPACSFIVDSVTHQQCFLPSV